MKKIGKDDTNKGKIDFVETSITSYFSTYNRFEFQRGSKKSIKEEFHYPSKIKYITTNINTNYSKIKKETVKGSLSYGTLIKTTNSETITEDWEKNEKFEYKNTKTQKKNEICGMITNKSEESD